MTEKQVRDALHEHESALVAYAYRMLKDVDLARDVVQDTFIRLHRQEPEKVAKGLKTWLYTVCRNRALDHLRKNKRVVEMEDEKIMRMPDAAATPAERADLDDRVAQVKSLMGQLSDNQRTVILLKFEDGMSYQEIADHTGLSTSNVGFLIHAGLKKVRSLLPADLLNGLHSTH